MTFRPCWVIAGFFDLAKRGLTRSWSSLWRRAGVRSGDRYSSVRARACSWIWDDVQGSLSSLKEARHVNVVMVDSSVFNGTSLSKCDNKLRPCKLKACSCAIV